MTANLKHRQRKNHHPKKVKLQAVGRQVATKLEMRPAIQCEAHCGQPFGRQRDSVRQCQDLVAAWTQLYLSVLPSLKLDAGQIWCTASGAQSESHGSHPKTNYSSKTAIDKICELQPALYINHIAATISSANSSTSRSTKRQYHQRVVECRSELVRIAGKHPPKNQWTLWQLWAKRSDANKFCYLKTQWEISISIEKWSSSTHLQKPTPWHSTASFIVVIDMKWYESWFIKLLDIPWLRTIQPQIVSFMPFMPFKNWAWNNSQLRKLPRPTCLQWEMTNRMTFHNFQKKKARLVAFNVSRARGTCGTCGTSVKLTPPTVGSTRLKQISRFYPTRKGKDIPDLMLYITISWDFFQGFKVTKSDKLQKWNVQNYCKQDLYISFLEYLAEDNCCASSSKWWTISRG